MIRQTVLRRYVQGRLALAMMVATLALSACSQSRLDILFSEEPSLSTLQAQLNSAFEATLSGVTAQRRAELIREQKEWSDGREEACLATHLLGAEDPKGYRRGQVQCLRVRMETRIARLRDEAAMGRIALVADETGTLCRNVLAKDRLVWQGREGDSRGVYRDRFRYSLPDGLTLPAWEILKQSKQYTVMKAKFGGELGGPAGTLFLVRNSGIIREPWLAIIKPEELARFENELQGLLSVRYTYDIDNQITGLFQRLEGGKPKRMREILRDAVWDGLWLYTIPNQRSADFSSTPVLIPRISELDSGNWPFIEAHVLIAEGKMHVVAHDGHGILGLFQLTGSGDLKLRCKHVAAASWQSQQIETLNPDFTCPPASNLALRAIPWKNPNAYPVRTILDLPDWGGPRPMIRVQAAHGYIFPHVFVGDSGALNVEAPAKRTDRPSDHWAPFATVINHDEVEIRLSDRGPYVVARDYPQPRDRSQEPPTTYYRIFANGVQPVCRTRDQTMPPAGYPKAP